MGEPGAGLTVDPGPGHSCFLRRAYPAGVSGVSPWGWCSSPSLLFSICSPGRRAEASSLLQPTSPFLPVPPTQPLGSCTTSSTGDPHVHGQETPFLLRWEAEGSARRSRCPIRPEGQRPADGPTQPAWPGGMGGSRHRVLDRRRCSKFQFLHSLAVRSWAKDFPSLTPGFLVHKIRVS